MPRQHILAAALLLVASEFLFASMGATIKALSSGLPVTVIVFFRNLVALAILLPWLLRRGTGGLATRRPHLHLLRSLSGLGAMYCFFWALSAIPLADAVLLKLTAPLFIPLIALAWLGESLSLRITIAIVVGFAGVALVLDPSPGSVSPVAIAAVCGGALAALAKVAIRRMSDTEPGPRIVFYFSLVGTIAAAPMAWLHWVDPTPAQWGLLLVLGLVATGGQLLMTRAYALAPAGRVGVFAYTTVLFASAYGWLLWDERPDLTWALGAALIIAAGVLAGSRARGTAPQSRRSPQGPSMASVMPGTWRFTKSQVPDGSKAAPANSESPRELAASR